MASSFVDVCKFNPTLGGLTDWVVSSAVTGYQTPASAGAVNGATYSYRAESSPTPTDWEIGIGTYTTGTTTLTRTTVLASSTGSKVNFGSAPQVGVVALSADLLAAGGVFNCGQLTYTSTTALAFLPYNGASIRIGGSVFQIPASTGIAGLGTPTSVFLNGVAAQTLAINTTYFIYAFSNSGTVTADFSTTGHVNSSTAGNVGTEIKSGDNTRTLIGMVRTGGTVIYASDIQTASWFNRRSKTALQAQSLAAAGNSVAINFVTWADEAFSYATAGFLSNNGVFISVWQDRIDTVNSGVASQGTIFAANGQLVLNSQKWATATEGNHAYDSNLSATGGTPSSAGTSSIMIRG